MADFFTDAEIAKMSQIPEGFEKIPEEHAARYFLLALEQIGMVAVTLSNLVLQGSRGENTSISPGAAMGCAAGLQRAMHYCQGIRAIRGYEKPKTASEPVAAKVAEADFERVIPGAEAFKRLEEKGI